MVLMVQENGATIGKRSNCLVVETTNGKKEISVEQIEELHVSPCCSISSDAVQLCMKKDVWVVFVNKYGDVTAEIEPFSGGSSPIYKRNQLMLMHSSEGIELVKGFLSQKIENRIRQLKDIRRNKRKMETIQILTACMDKMQEQVSKIQNVTGTDMDSVRATLQGYEGNAGKMYFETISYLLPADMKFEKRTRKAEDIYNSVLNYLYGILYAKVKRTAYKCRLDPYIGIMHVDAYNKPTFVYDFIECQRIICDELAFEICSQELITMEDVNEVTDEGLRFSDEARKFLVSEFYKKMNEKCFFKKKQVTVEKKMYLEMLDVAQRIGRLDTDVLAAV